MAFYNFKANYGFGLGFQMLGTQETYLSDYSYVIEKITGKILNLENGSFVASKLITEFGILGIGILILYIYWFIKFLLIYPVKISKSTYFYGIIAGFFIDLFIRGTGYFNTEVFFIFVAIYSLIFLKKSYFLRRNFNANIEYD
ncbi:hypothetical protein FVE67_03375 [Thermosulfurimonas marina]|uniref:O-antigen ligase family protein n=1 Tax=Thermosulfurimonas marina TaxID=2047767 RepID=A0A6H1WRW2_9BACT|nr:hypothetical protein [Thermosulfurimonas marina]QJA05894.1 hypothetical protein FVE67_03375 [Thermosulfurimonas marina]